MAKKRRSFEEGHRRKFMVVVDDTPEVDRAIAYAARRAERTGGDLVMLYVVNDTDFRGFLGVEKVMRAEAREQADLVLGKAAEKARAYAAVDPECVLREGANAAEVVVQHIESDEDIAILVLAAGTGSEGPGPLVSAVAGRASATFPIPVTIVPGTLTDEEIAALA